MVPVRVHITGMKKKGFQSVITNYFSKKWYDKTKHPIKNNSKPPNKYSQYPAN